MKYRTGIPGALLDEYEKALNEYIDVISRVKEDVFSKILDNETKDKDCKSIQTISIHVIDCGYYYAEFIRKRLNIDIGTMSKKSDFGSSVAQSITQLKEMFVYTEKTFEGRMDMNDNELESNIMKTGWGTVYDVEQLMEHAIVHILRHRRQVEKLMSKG